MTIIYNETAEFAYDFKKLLKKFQSLTEDLEVVKQYDIELFHCQKIDRHGIFEIENTENNENLQFFKIKKFACKALKGRGSKSGIRVIYAFHCQSYKVDFIEIYFKGEKENEDRKRIKNYLKNFERRANFVGTNFVGVQSERRRGGASVSFKEGSRIFKQRAPNWTS